MIVKLDYDEVYPVFFENNRYEGTFPFETTIEEWNEYTKAAQIFWGMQGKMEEAWRKRRKK